MLASGNELRQMAEMGLGVVGMEYEEAQKAERRMHSLPRCLTTWPPAVGGTNRVAG